MALLLKGTRLSQRGKKRQATFISPSKSKILTTSHPINRREMAQFWHSRNLLARKYQNLKEKKKTKHEKEEKSLKIILSMNFCPTVIFGFDKYQQKPKLVMDC